MTTGLIDLHVHPSLKMYYLPYLRRTFHAMVYSGPIWNPLSFRTQYSNISKAPIKVMLCTHYVIEQGFVCHGIRKFARSFSWVMAPWFYRRLRTDDPWKVTLEMMDTLEDSIANTNRWVGKGGRRLKLVRSFEELDNVAENEIAMIHSIEGSHSLGYGPKPGQSLDDFWTQTKKRVRALKERGVCLITLSHFWDNMFSPQTKGVEYVPKVRPDGAVVPWPEDWLFTMKRAEWKWGDPSKLSNELAELMLDEGIIIDVAHAQEHARWKIYDLCEKKGRPVVATHNGLQHFFNHEYNLSDAEVLRIHKLGGVVGLILSRRWLVDPIKRYKSKGDGIDDLIENMVYIRDLTGDCTAIGIGTDFDGLTDPFKDAYKPQQLHEIKRKMAVYFSEEEIEQIFYGNSLRLLKNGWGAKR